MNRVKVENGRHIVNGREVSFGIFKQAAVQNTKILNRRITLVSKRYKEKMQRYQESAFREAELRWLQDSDPTASRVG